jgi:hypothetical protein
MSGKGRSFAPCVLPHAVLTATQFAIGDFSNRKLFTIPENIEQDISNCTGIGHNRILVRWQHALRLEWSVLMPLRNRGPNDEQQNEGLDITYVCLDIWALKLADLSPQAPLDDAPVRRPHLLGPDRGPSAGGSHPMNPLNSGSGQRCSHYPRR